MDQIPHLVITYNGHTRQSDKHLPKKTPEPSISGLKQGHLQQFLCRNDKPVFSQTQRDLTTAICNWIATSGRPIAVADDKGLQVVLHIELQNELYTLSTRCTADHSLVDQYASKLHHIKDDMQRFFTKLMQKSFLAAYCNINPSV